MTKRKVSKSKPKGLHAHRFRNNPEEKRFSDAWDEMNVLCYLLGDGARKVPVEPREEQVAATVIQWLGSPVGQSFLEQLGYKK